MPVAMNVELAVPATVLGSSSNKAKSAVVTKIPPGPIVVMQIPPISAIAIKIKLNPRLMDNPALQRKWMREINFGYK
jgi:hypothetical protein